MPLVKSKDGVRVHYEVHDFTDPWVDSPVLLLQHGFGRTASYWYNFTPYLSRHYKVVVPTMRGFGESDDFDLDSGLNLENCLADLDAIIADVGVDSVHYVGESIGGILGIAFAAQYPQRVRTLSLMTAPLYIDEQVQKTFAFGHASWEEALEKEGVYEWAKKANSATRFPPGTNADLIDWYASEAGKNKLASMKALVRFAIKANVTPFLDKIRAPVLGLYPAAGKVATDEQQLVIKKGIRNIKVVHLPTSFHMVWVLYPSVCARHVLHFIAEHEGRAIVD